MYSTFEFEKLINIDDTEMIQVIHKSKAEVKEDTYDKTSCREFLCSYRKKNLVFLISEYLADHEKVQLLYTNTFCTTNLKRMFNKTGYEKMKNEVIKLAKSEKILYNLLTNDADRLRYYIKLDYLYPNGDAKFAAQNLLGKWLNRFYLQKRIYSNPEDNSEKTKKKIIEEESDIILNNIKMSDQGFIYLLNIISHNCSLETLDISNNSITDIHFIYFKRATRKNKGIKYLNLGSNPFGTKLGITGLVDSFNNLSLLIRLQLDNINLDQNGAEILSSQLGTLKNLETITISDNPINNFGVEKILISLEKLKYVNYVSISKTDIDSGICTILKQYLKESGVTRLELNENKLEDKFINTMGNSWNSSQLRILEMNQCLLTTHGLDTLCRNLIKNKSITDLSLNKNVFDLEAKTIINNYFFQNDVIKRIGMANNLNTKCVCPELMKKYKLGDDVYRSWGTEMQKFKEKVRTTYKGRNIII